MPYIMPLETVRYKEIVHFLITVCRHAQQEHHDHGTIFTSKRGIPYHNEAPWKAVISRA